MKNKKGFTLPDVVLIIITLAILAVAGMDFYVALLHRQQEVTQQMTAIDLATAQMEDLTEPSVLYTDASLNANTNYPNPTASLQPDVPSHFGVSYSVGLEQFVGSFKYKPITVTVLRPQVGGMAPRQTVLTGYKVNQ